VVMYKANIKNRNEQSVQATASQSLTMGRETAIYDGQQQQDTPQQRK